MNTTDTPTTRAPDAVWDYFEECWIAQKLLPAPDGLLVKKVVIDGVTKTVANLTPDDICRLAEVERDRVTAVTIGVLDLVDGAVEMMRRASS